MSRNAAGTYSLPTGRPVVSGTVISATAENTFDSDVATEITNSLDRTGKGPMQAALRHTDGTVAAPGITFDSETGSGIRRAGAGDVRHTILGADVLKIIASGIYAAVHGAITAASAILRGAVADGASAVGVTLDNSVTLANATAKLLSVQNNGTEKLSVDLNGVVQGSAAGASLSLRGTPADGATAVGVVVDTSVALANASAKLLSVRNHTTEKAYVNKDGKAFVVGLDAGSAAVTSVATPSAATDAATKGYVDGFTGVAKAWAHLTLGGAGAVTVDKGLNVASASWATTVLTINFTSNMADANYTISTQVQFTGNSNFAYVNNATPPAVGSFSLLFSQANVPTNWSSGIIVTVVVFD